MFAHYPKHAVCTNPPPEDTMAMKHCRECGDKVKEDVIACPACGQSILTPASFQFWCFVTLLSGVSCGAMVMFVVLKMTNVLG